MDVVKEGMQRVGVTEEDAGRVGGDHRGSRKKTVLHNEHFYQFNKSLLEENVMFIIP